MASNDPEVSIVIPVKNGGDVFPGTLAAVLGQDIDCTFDVVVIDSGSTDGTVEIARRHQAADGRIHLFEIPSVEFSHSGTRNLGASKTDSRLIAFITADALPADRHWLRNLIRPFAKDERIAGVFGRHLPYPNCDPLTARDIHDHMRGFDAGPAVVWMDDPARYQVDLPYRQMLHFYSDNNSCMRRSVWREIPYPPVPWGEDQAWARQIIEAGYKKAYAGDAAVFHSHNYGFLERVERFRDEREFWMTYFGYPDITTVRKLARETFLGTRSDLRWWKENYGSVPCWTWIQVLLRHLSRHYGDYLGHRPRTTP